MFCTFVRSLRCCGILFCALLLLASPARAQFGAASVLGYVHDSSGAAVPSSKIVLTNAATKTVRTATSDGEGRYEFVSIPVGRYTVTSEAPGFEHRNTALRAHGGCSSAH